MQYIKYTQKLATTSIKSTRKSEGREVTFPTKGNIVSPPQKKSTQFQVIWLKDSQNILLECFCCFFIHTQDWSFNIQISATSR